MIYRAVVAFARWTGMWRYPIQASGDLETMRRKDKIYWLYKAQFPIVHPQKQSGLESHFEDARTFRWSLPIGFEPTSELRISAVGDLMDHAYLPNSRGLLYEKMAETIFGADLSIANLECVLNSAGNEPFVISAYEGTPLFYRPGSFDAVKGLSGRNYSFMSTACNHTLDAGEAGTRLTTERLAAEEIAFNGINEMAAQADAATLVHKNGMTIALISHTFGLNARRPPDGKPWLVNRTNLNASVRDIDFGQFERQIQHSRWHAADIVVALLHWGMEHEYYPRPEQLDVARHLAEIGVDVIIGHHPHVVQPMECYRTRREPARIVPVYYSLGNLITPFSHPAFRLSAVARITLVKGTCSDGSVRTYVAHADSNLVFQEIDTEASITWLRSADPNRPPA